MKYLIIDIDGTIAFTPECKTLEEFQGLDHKKFKPKKIVLNYVQNLIKSGEEFSILFLTARCESLMENTLKWLHKHLDLQSSRYRLSMRPEGCLKSAHDFKLTFLSQRKILPSQVQLWIDDDEDIIKHAQNKGYPIVHPRTIEDVLIDEYWRE